jgi:hypothetical protein
VEEEEDEGKDEDGVVENTVMMRRKRRPRKGRSRRPHMRGGQMRGKRWRWWSEKALGFTGGVPSLYQQRKPSASSFSSSSQVALRIVGPVTIQRAAGLAKADKFGLSDPYELTAA